MSCCPYGEFFENEAIMTPIHECPAPPPILDDLIVADRSLQDFVATQDFIRSEVGLMFGDVPGAKVIDLRGRW
jgi:hypothetical protein